MRLIEAKFGMIEERHVQHVFEYSSLGMHEGPWWGFCWHDMGV